MRTLLEFPNQSRPEVVEEDAEKWMEAQVELLKASELLLASVEMLVLLGKIRVDNSLLKRVRKAIAEAR